MVGSQIVSAHEVLIDCSAGFEHCPSEHDATAEVACCDGAKDIARAHVARQRGETIEARVCGFGIWKDSNVLVGVAGQFDAPLDIISVEESVWHEADRAGGIGANQRTAGGDIVTKDGCGGGSGGGGERCEWSRAKAAGDRIEQAALFMDVVGGGVGDGWADHDEGGGGVQCVDEFGEGIGLDASVGIEKTEVVERWIVQSMGHCQVEAARAAEVVGGAVEMAGDGWAKVRQ